MNSKISGSNITGFNDLEIVTSSGSPSSKPMSEFNTNYGFKNFRGRMDVKLNIQSDFIMFFVVKHSWTIGDYLFGMHLNFASHHDKFIIDIRKLPGWIFRFFHTWGSDYDDLTSDMINKQLYDLHCEK